MRKKVSLNECSRRQSHDFQKKRRYPPSNEKEEEEEEEEESISRRMFEEEAVWRKREGGDGLSTKSSEKGEGLDSARTFRSKSQGGRSGERYPCI